MEYPRTYYSTCLLGTLVVLFFCCKHPEEDCQLSTDFPRQCKFTLEPPSGLDLLARCITTSDV